jgi:threonine dehydrogenase-like Zn-dependent dehydrogenase
MAKAIGAERIDYLDHDRARLDLAAKLGANPIAVGRGQPQPLLEPRYDVAVDARGEADELRLLLRSLALEGLVAASDPDGSPSPCSSSTSTTSSGWAGT